ncbi:MAG: hypothetical protein MUE85_14600 [Microscillaceae bacterium]|jgi:hypothetical protein|nr:hypothetical protein [Microscillaceae bacterium]
MGGNLFKLGRLPKTQYLRLESQIRQYLDHKLGQEYYRIPRYYAQKPDFGDMDIIVSLAQIGANWQQTRLEIVQDLGISQYKASGAVFSTVYQRFQVDYFPIAPEYFESTYNYLSFNDLGNLIGKIFRRFNLKYGETGLQYVFRRQDSHYKQEILISTDFAQICAFLGLDYAQWLQGFENLSDMFDWVIASPYFSVKPYQDELAGEMEKRLDRRTTIQKFNQYLLDNQIVKDYSYLENKDDYLPWIADFFPEAQLLPKIAQEKIREQTTLAIQAKFNGNLLMAWLPQLSGKALGTFIQDFKSQFADFEAFVLATDPDEIKRQVVAFAQKLPS